MASFERKLNELGIRGGVGYAGGKSAGEGNGASQWTIAPFVSGFIGGEKHGS